MSTKGKILNELGCTLINSPMETQRYKLMQHGQEWVIINDWKEIVKINNPITQRELKLLLELLDYIDDEDDYY